MNDRDGISTFEIPEDKIVSVRELIDKYIIWCMNLIGEGDIRSPSPGSMARVGRMVGLSRKTVYNRLRKITGDGRCHTES